MPVGGRMANVASGDHVDHVFGDIGGVVGDAFQVLRHQDQLEGGVHDRRIAHHIGQQLAENLVAELVDLIVAREHGARQFDVTAHQRIEAVAHHLFCQLAHARQIDVGLHARMAHNTLRRLRDVDRLVAHAFQIVIDTRYGQHEAEVRGHKLLQRQQLHHTVIDLNLQLVDGVLFIEHGASELLVRVEHGVDRLVHGAFSQASHPEQPLLQFVEVALKMTFHTLHPLLDCNVAVQRAHPKRPVMYASVRGSEGVVNICPVGENSISSPFNMNAVESLTRAACCILWVTITRVQDGFNSKSNSSIFAVLTGSRAEHGSSSSKTSGSTASARAMHNLCCCPPDSAYADF